MDGWLERSVSELDLRKKREEDNYTDIQTILKIN